MELKEVNSQVDVRALLKRFVLLFMASLFLISCGENENNLKLPGQLLIRDHDRLIILDGSGKKEKRLESLVWGDARWSSDGRHIVYVDSKHQVRLLELETGEEIQLFPDNLPIKPLVFDWSPHNSQELVFVGWMHDEESYGIFVVNILNTPDLRLVWRCEYGCKTLQWSLDEQYIFVSENLPSGNHEGSARVVQINIYTSEADVVFSLNTSIDAMRWSPKEDQVAIMSYDEGGFLVNKYGKMQGQVATGSVGELIWSPDGDWLAFTQELVEPESGFVVNAYNIETGETERLYPRKNRELFQNSPFSSVFGWHE